MAKSATAHHPWPVRKELAAHMARRQRENLARNVPAEDWMAKKLRGLTDPKLTWTRQATWGFRVFDFWCWQIGIAVEVDGSTHDPVVDSERDALDWKRSGIIVLRVRNWNEGDAAAAINRIALNQTWNARRQLLGKKPIRGAW